MSLRILLCALLSLTNAQVQVKGRFQETVLALQKSAHSAASVYSPEQKVNNLLLQTEEMFNEAMVTKPYKFAESVELNLDVKNDGQWVDTRALDGTPIKIWRAIVASDEALSVSLQFDEFHLPEGAELYMIGRETFLGAFTPHVNNKDDNSFATVPVPGDFIGLELVVPMDKSVEKMNKILREELKMKVGKIAHGFRNFPKSFNDSGSCNLDVACYPDSQYVCSIWLYIFFTFFRPTRSSLLL